MAENLQHVHLTPLILNTTFFLRIRAFIIASVASGPFDKSSLNAAHRVQLYPWVCRSAAEDQVLWQLYISCQLKWDSWPLTWVTEGYPRLQYFWLQKNNRLVFTADTQRERQPYSIWNSHIRYVRWHCKTNEQFLSDFWLQNTSLGDVKWCGCRLVTNRCCSRCQLWVKY